MGWNSYKLVTFGCSHTYGHGLSDCIAEDGSNGPTASQQAWPSILSGLTDMKVDNASRPGAGNLMITKAIVDYVLTNPGGAESLSATLLVGNETNATKISVNKIIEKLFTKTAAKKNYICYLDF